MVFPAKPIPAPTLGATWFRLQLVVRAKRAIWLLALLAILCLASAGYYVFAPARTPAGQLALTDLGRSGFTAFEQIFDDAADRVRIVALFSPT